MRFEHKQIRVQYYSRNPQEHRYQGKGRNAMSEQTGSTTQPISSWRLRLGVIIFLFSITVPATGIPVVATLDLSVTIKSSVSGALLISGELLGILAVAVMGKPGYVYIKSQFFGLMKRYSPAHEISRSRYNIGLVMLRNENSTMPESDLSFDFTAALEN